VPAEALVLVLCAAVIHAGWNTLLAGARDSRASTNLALLVGSLVLVPIAAATWRIDADALPYLIPSAALEVAYVLLLGAAYDHTELSLVYPVARGVSPVTVLLLSFWVGGHPAAIGAIGALLVCAGVLGLRGLGRRGLAFGVSLGALVGIVTTIDHYGVQHANTFPYLLVVTVPSAVVAIGRELARGRLPALRTEVTWRTGLAGLGFCTTYALILAALRRAPAAPVAAVRETAIVVAVAFGALFLREPVTRRRVAAACVITLGAALAALGH
jgi:drug/metabolite transporter (DMT)-like permease